MKQQQVQRQKRRKTDPYEPAGPAMAAHLRESCRDDEVSAVLARCVKALAIHDNGN